MTLYSHPVFQGGELLLDRAKRGKLLFEVYSIVFTSELLVTTEAKRASVEQIGAVREPSECSGCETKRETAAGSLGKLRLWLWATNGWLGGLFDAVRGS